MAEIVGLKNKKCVPCEGGVQPLSESEINRLQKQVGMQGGRHGAYVARRAASGASLRR